MTPAQLKAAGIRMYGRKHWASEMSLQLGLVPSTIYRHANLKTENIPVWMEVAVLALLERHKEIVRAEKLAREQRARANHRYKGRLTTLKHPERSKRNPANVRPTAPPQPPVLPPPERGEG